MSREPRRTLIFMAREPIRRVVNIAITSDSTGITYGTGPPHAFIPHAETPLGEVMWDIPQFGHLFHEILARTLPAVAPAVAPVATTAVAPLPALSDDEIKSIREGIDRSTAAIRLLGGGGLRYTP